MVIMILFHYSGNRCLKRFYLEQASGYPRHLLPHLLLYNRFIELEKEVVNPLKHLMINRGPSLNWSIQGIDHLIISSSTCQEY